MCRENYLKKGRDEVKNEALELMERFGLSYGQIARWLHKEHGLQLSRSGVYHLLNS